MFEVLLFIGIWAVLYYGFFRKKQPRINTSKTHQYYLSKFPELLEEPVGELPDKKPKVVINITNNITHNNLHLYSTDEGIQPRQH